MASYLVTGVAGFIASSVAELLLHAGHSVVGIDNMNDAYDVRMKEQRIKKSQGDAERFLEILSEYRKAKVVTERRLYLEMMEEVLPKVKKYVVDAGSRGQLINLLNLDGLQRKEVKE